MPSPKRQSRASANKRVSTQPQQEIALTIKKNKKEIDQYIKEIHAAFDVWIGKDTPHQ